MKAIFVSRAHGCVDCPFFWHDVRRSGRCSAMSDQAIGRDVPMQERPDWCPLLKEGQVMVALEPEK